MGGGASEFARRGGGEGRGKVDCWIPLYSWGCWILSSTVGRWFCPDPRFGLTTTVSGDLEGKRGEEPRPVGVTMTYDVAGETSPEAGGGGTNNSTSRMGLPFLLALPRIGLI